MRGEWKRDFFARPPIALVPLDQKGNLFELIGLAITPSQFYEVYIVCKNALVM
jgi:hypothetical protein